MIEKNINVFKNRIFVNIFNDIACKDKFFLIIKIEKFNVVNILLNFVAYNVKI